VIISKREPGLWVHAVCIIASEHEAGTATTKGNELRCGCKRQLSWLQKLGLLEFWLVVF